MISARGSRSPIPLTASPAGHSGSQAISTLGQATGAAAQTGLGESPALSRSPPAALSALSASTPLVLRTRRPRP
eukprot:6886588-Alexandrium_andersonii.AAC.1